ncbi:MAG TPA: DUF1259 domain-containing protein [Acidobacteriota bacterium]|nr:DUF1259 domain-containing protein [Acidobacteriota bacterium]
MRRRIAALVGTGLMAAGLSIAGPQQSQIPADYQEVLTYLGRTGDFKSGVLKVNVPRNDLRVAVHGVAVPTAFGFGGWVAMTKGEGGQDVMMGDLVLLQDEVNPVMSSLLDNDLEVTALHNHFFWEEPRLFYMHIHGMGKAADLARRVKPGLDLIGGLSGKPQAPGPLISPAPSGGLTSSELARIVGRPGETLGAVYKITVGREDIDLRAMGAVIGPRMGLNSWAAFFGSDDHAVIAGDIAMLENEVTPVLKALRANGLDVVALHHHMTGIRPVIIFLHYWGEGPAAKLAAGFRAALDVSAGKPK